MGTAAEAEVEAAKALPEVALLGDKEKGADEEEVQGIDWAGYARIIVAGAVAVWTLFKIMSNGCGRGACS